MNTYIKISLIAIFFFTFLVSNAQVNATNCNPQNNGSAIGLNTTATGNNSFASGKSTIANETNSLAFGFNSYATGSNSMAIGYRCTSDHLRSYSFGAYAHSTAANAMSIGNFITSNAEYAMVIGKGNNPNLFLVNNYDNSLMIGFNSSKPTFFVEGALSTIKTGRIGIGDVTSPQAKLHIRGDEGENVELFLEPTGTHTVAQISLGDQEHYIQKNEDNLYFQMDKGGHFSFLNGYLTIGGNTVSPSGNMMEIDGDVLCSNLSVDNKISCKELETYPAKWKDEVFKENYNLLSLEEVETFITKNHHLPDIPSEAEVMENGIDLIEMNTLLLQKIEEMTIYIIQIKKEITKIKAERGGVQ